MRAGRLLLVCGWILAARAGLAQHKPVHPDVFLVTIDTLRADHVHCYGYKDIQTPGLDHLASDGVRFTQAFTLSPITNTSHASILTGLRPSAHGVTDFAVPLSPVHQTLAQLLKKQGYQTAAFIGSVILDSKTLAPGFDNGFDFYDHFPERPRTASRWGRVERRAMDVVQHAESWLTAHPKGPRFVWVHLYDPHDPYEPPAPYSQMYKDHLYDGEIAYADSALVRLVAYLKKSMLYENALMVVVADHGEGLGEHHEDTHGIFLYDSTLHVPLILKLPGGKNAGRVIDAQVRAVDILPTVLDLAGVPGPRKLDGASLMSYLAGTEQSGRVALSETDYPLQFGWAPLRAVRETGFKFIEAPRPELYDLQADPAELENKYEPWNSRVQDLRAMLAQSRAGIPEPARSAGVVGPETIAELKALGYLGPADAGSATNVPGPSLLPDPKDKIEEQNLLHRAMLASEAGNSAVAHEALEKVLQVNPASYAALRQLGDLELAEGHYSQAVERLKRAREIRADDSVAAFSEGLALEKMGDFSGARDALEGSVKLAPGELQGRLALGRVYLAVKDVNRAEDQFEAALLLQPASKEAKLGLARAYIADGTFADAVTQLLPLSRTDARDPEIFELLALAYSGLGKKNEAQQAQSRSKLLRQHR